MWNMHNSWISFFTLPAIFYEAEALKLWFDLESSAKSSILYDFEGYKHHNPKEATKMAGIHLIDQNLPFKNDQ